MSDASGHTSLQGAHVVVTGAARGIGEALALGVELDLYVHPGAGHGVNFGLNATGFYGEITKFLDANF